MTALKCHERIRLINHAAIPLEHKALLWALHDHFHHKHSGRGIFASIDRLAAMLGKSSRTIARWMKSLRGSVHKLIRWEGEPSSGKTTRYWIDWHQLAQVARVKFPTSAKMAGVPPVRTSGVPPVRLAGVAEDPCHDGRGTPVRLAEVDQDDTCPPLTDSTSTPVRMADEEAFKEDSFLGVFSPPSFLPSSNSVERQPSLAVVEEELPPEPMRDVLPLPERPPAALQEPSSEQPPEPPPKLALDALPLPEATIVELATPAPVQILPLPAPTSTATTSSAEPGTLRIEATFAQLGEEHIEAARMLHLAGFETLGDIAALDCRGALIGQLKEVRKRRARTGTHSAYLIGQMTQAGVLPRVATTAERVLRRHQLSYGQALPTATGELIPLAGQRPRQAGPHVGSSGDWNVNFGVNLDDFFGGSGGIGSETDRLAHNDDLDDLYDLIQPMGAK